MLVNRGVTRLSLEIEVPEWTGRKYIDVVQDLLNSGHMMGERRHWTAIHRYRCNCEYGCRIVRSGAVIVPPLVSVSYDASLPDGGAEFVTSPIVMIDGLEPLREVWETVTRNAVWTDQKPDLRGEGLCSPSVHIHCSVTMPGGGQVGDILGDARARQRGELDRAMGGMRLTDTGNDILHALWLFSPELLLLADLAGVRRGLRFRQFLRQADQHGHHGFVHLRSVQDDMLHIEWRLFEAAFDKFDYIEQAAYLAAVMTRALATYDNVVDMLAFGVTARFDRDLLERAVEREDVDAILALVSTQRLEFLYNLCIQQLDDDERGRDMLHAFFGAALRR